MWQPNERYPDPAVRVLDPSFGQYRLALASVERLYTGCRWAEGPVYFGDGRYLLWSDIPNNRVLRWDEESGAVSVFRKPSNNANGHTRDRRGRLIACEHDARRVVRFEYDGAITVLANSYNGKPLNSPNDVVVKSDGSVWFSDPTFGILGYYEGHKAPSENKPAVYRLDPATGKLTMMADDIPGPNGLAFSPDEKKLYVVASRAEPHRTIVSYDVSADGMKLERRQGADRCRAGRLARRLPRRCRRQPVVRLGHGQARSRRRAHLQQGRQADRPYRPAGALRQPLLRRPPSQPPVHDGEPLALCALREHPGRGRRLIGSCPA